MAGMADVADGKCDERVTASDSSHDRRSQAQEEEADEQ